MVAIESLLTRYISGVFVFTEWSGGGVKVAHRLCDWMYNVSESSISTPDHWLPRNAKCTYTIHIADGHRLDAVFHFYSLGLVGKLGLYSFLSALHCTQSIA